MKKAFLIVAFIPILAFGQETLKLSLEDAQAYALKHSVQAKNADQDLRAASLQIKQLTASGLPQVYASAGYQNFIKQPVQLLPGEFAGGEPGTFVPITFGTEQNMSADITASQLLFDGSFFVGLKAAKTYYKLAQNIQKTSKAELKATISELYNAVLVTDAFAKNQEALYHSFKDLAFELTRRWEEGMIEEFDKDQMVLQAAKFNSLWKNAQLQKDISRKMLKLSMGVSYDTKLELTETLEDVMSGQTSEQLLSKELSVEGSTQYQLAEGQMDLQMLNVRKEQSTFLPSINMFLSHQQNAFANDFDFFSSDQDWFGSTLFGVNLKLPIFNSGLKYFNIQAAKVEYEKSKNNFELAHQSLQMQQESAKNTYLLKLDLFLSTQQLMAVIERVKETAIIKHKEGLISSTELITVVQQYSQTQASYLTSLLEMVQAKNQFELTILK
jgi:outer membrane protein